jgi:biotin carboxylase
VAAITTKVPGRTAFGASGAEVLVVGTTPDYVERIHASHPQSALFLIREGFRNHPRLANIPAPRMCFDPFADDRQSLAATKRWVTKEALPLAGVACFDCEALLTAGRIAQGFNLPFAELPAIERARNKFETKRFWRKANVPTPAGIVASGLKDTLAFFHSQPEGIVIKPLSASGSELAFYCTTPAEVREAVETLKEQLPGRRTNPLFQPLRSLTADALALDPCRSFLVESYVSGIELSCDFFLMDQRVRIIRSTGKVKAPSHPFGSMLAYTFPARFPDGVSIDNLSHVCLRAATALGFTRGHFMLDYMVGKDGIMLLEMTPRPGGDSIADLIAAATGFDLIGLHLDWARGVHRVPDFTQIAPESFASINFYAPSQGIIAELDESLLKTRAHVLQVVLNKQVGDTVLLPPADYDNRLLGYCIVATPAGWDIAALAGCLNKELKVTIRPLPCKASHHAGK